MHLLFINNLHVSKSTKCGTSPSKEQQSVIYIDIPDKITAVFKKYERLARPFQLPPANAVVLHTGNYKELACDLPLWGSLGD